MANIAAALLRLRHRSLKASCHISFCQSKLARLQYELKSAQADNNQVSSNVPERQSFSSSNTLSFSCLQKAMDDCAERIQECEQRLKKHEAELEKCKYESTLSHTERDVLRLTIQ